MQFRTRRFCQISTFFQQFSIYFGGQFLETLEQYGKVGWPDQNGKTKNSELYDFRIIGY